MIHRFEAMGTEVLVGGADGEEAAAVEELFAAREQVFSRFQPGSELSRVNAATGEAVVVSPVFARALRRALRAARLTDGLVDPTVGAAVVAAGYDRDLAALVPGEQPPAATTVPGRRALSLTGTLLRRPPGLTLDLNGVVKGLTVDDALGLLSGPGFVSAGGDAATRGGAAVALPGGGAVELRRGGIATSGVTRRRWLRAGVPAHHLVDPRTGLPSASPWAEVTVVASTCCDADVAAKAAFLLGAEGPTWLDERRLAGRFLAATGEVVVSACWHASLERAEAAPCH